MAHISSGYGSEIKTWECHDCKKEIISPLGKPFGNGDGKTRCAACAVELYMKQPGACIIFKGRDILADTPS